MVPPIGGAGNGACRYGRPIGRRCTVPAIAGTVSGRHGISQGGGDGRRPYRAGGVWCRAIARHGVWCLLSEARGTVPANMVGLLADGVRCLLSQARCLAGTASCGAGGIAAGCDRSRRGVVPGDRWALFGGGAWQGPVGALRRTPGGVLLTCSFWLYGMPPPCTGHASTTTSQSRRRTYPSRQV